MAVLMEAAAAAAELKRRAEKAAAEVAEVGKLTVAEGNRGDRAINDWAAASVYRDITGKEPTTSVGGPNRPDEGIAGGPLIRFLTAAGGPLQLEFSEDAWRGRVRTVLKGAPRCRIDNDLAMQGPSAESGKRSACERVTEHLPRRTSRRRPTR
ncbi:hypothetical protein [Rhodoblastus sp.]|uniref:hypothetical protein n=1 Tax=Rhodoblastus sp. TaxID=1962975 RepID=UPI003F9A028F